MPSHLNFWRKKIWEIPRPFNIYLWQVLKDRTVVNPKGKFQTFNWVSNIWGARVSSRIIGNAFFPVKMSFPLYGQNR